MNEKTYYLTTWNPTGGTAEMKLWDNETVLCSSACPPSLSEPYITQGFGTISSFDEINKKWFVSYPCFDQYITLVPGQVLGFEVFENKDIQNAMKKTDRTAKFEKVLGDKYFSGQTSEYKGITDTQSFRFDRQPDDSILIYMLTELIASIMRDKTFKYDSRVPVDNRYAVRINPNYTNMLPYIFHAFLMF